MESRAKIAEALSKLIAEVGPILKESEVNAGSTNSYKAVSDRTVKEKVGKKMAELGLSIVPIAIDAKETVNSFADNYGKPKMSVFVSATVKYLLLHTSGESIEIVGYGHGVDSQDKAAGKATTYALKYLLLYLSLAPTGTEYDFTEDRNEDMPPVPVSPPAPKPAPAAPANSAPKTTPAQAVNKFEAEGKPAAPAGEQVDKPGRHPLKFEDDKWTRVADWVTSNKGKDPKWILEKLRVNNEFGVDVEKKILELLA